MLMEQDPGKNTTKLSDYLVDFLKEKGIRHGFFMIGGALGHIADSCATRGLKLYTVHHEQAAAFAAEGQALATHNAGLALATSGPGATNLVTGIASAYFASFPAVFITGQVNRSESNVGGKRRQVGFQETDIVSMVRGVTKYAVQIRDPDRVAYELEKAFFLAKDGRMGPVLLDVPFDVQQSRVRPQEQEHFTGSKEEEKIAFRSEIRSQDMDRIVSLIAAAKRPVVLFGHGARLSGAQPAARQFVEKAQAPFVSSLMGTDIIENSHPLCYGFIGTYGNRYSNLALANSDLVIVLGARLDSRQVGVQASKFAPNAKIIHVDADPNELGASVKETVSVKADVREFLEAILPRVPKPAARKEWVAYLDMLKQKYSEVRQEADKDAITPRMAISALCDASSEGDFISVDVGSHQMWFAQTWKVKRGQTVLTNGGMGPMGCSLPSAVGISISRGLAPVWVVVGDGGMQVNIQELQTAARHDIPLKIAVINNHSLGMLTQFQTENFQGRMTGSIDGYDAPDFVKVARAYGIAAERAESRQDLHGKIDWLSKQKGPCLLDITVPRLTWVLPKSSYSRPVHDMAPPLGEGEDAEAKRFLK